MKSLEQKINDQENLKDTLKEKLEVFFVDIEKNIEQEIENTKGENSWLDCFATQMNGIQLIFFKNINREKAIEITSEISHGQFGLEKINEMKDEYNDNPTEEQKEEIIKELKEYTLEIIDKNF